MPKDCQAGRDSARNALSKQFRIIGEQIPGVRSCDVVAIHDMRVASRRIRMALQIYRVYLPKKARKAMKAYIRTVGRALGRRRELDVMLGMLGEHREETHGIWKRFMDHIIGVLEVRQAREGKSCIEALAAVEAEEFAAIRDGLLAAIDSKGICVVPLATSELKEALAAVHDAHTWWEESGEDDDLHEVRIAIKRFRYACEFHKSIFGEAMEVYIARLKEVQSLLGEWNECRLLEEIVTILGSAAAYDLAQGAPLVAEAYAGRAAVLEEQFVEKGDALFDKKGRKAFKALLKANAISCCANKIGARTV